MKTINLNTGDGVKHILFPDGQPHVNVLDVNDGDFVNVVCSIKDSLRLFQLLLVSNALDNKFAVKNELHIPYLIGARYDRVMNDGDSFDLKVVASLINGLNFKKVYLYDVHSDVSLALINNSVSVSNKFLVEKYSLSDSILICPDAGASKKVKKYLEWNKNIVDVVYCNKSRDLTNGNLTLNVLEPSKCDNRNCVIIDDLCDGGGTFLGIASQIKPKSLSLIVTHGVFSKGTKIFESHFDEIIVSDSFCETYDSLIVKQIKIKI